MCLPSPPWKSLLRDPHFVITISGRHTPVRRPVPHPRALTPNPRIPLNRPLPIAKGKQSVIFSCSKYLFHLTYLVLLCIRHWKVISHSDNVCLKWRCEAKFVESLTQQLLYFPCDSSYTTLHISSQETTYTHYLHGTVLYCLSSLCINETPL